jgi:hypothetical protein
VAVIREISGTAQYPSALQMISFMISRVPPPIG